MAQWDALVRQDVIAEFGRLEVAPTATFPRKRDPELASLFADVSARSRAPPASAPAASEAAAASRTALLQQTEKVKDDRNFKAFTAESEQALCAELQFLRVLHEGDCWDKVNDCWVTSFLPPGGLVRIKSTNEVLFVLKVYWCSALCWPAEKECEGVRRKAGGCRSLVWKTVFDGDDVEVFPLQWASPVRVYLQARSAGGGPFKAHPPALSGRPAPRLTSVRAHIQGHSRTRTCMTCSGVCV